MAFWSKWFGAYTAGDVGGFNPGDPDGVNFDRTETFSRSLPFPQPSPWDGWPASWGVPQWDFQSRYNALVDVAWACLDLNARVLSAMPVYKTRRGQVVDPATWMTNPDRTIYTSWHEFAKQLFWDYLLGEAFVLPVAFGFDGKPRTFRVIPPWMIHVEMKGGVRKYNLGGVAGPDVSDEILHVRYKSTTDGAHGCGPLEQAGGRMLTAGILAQYARTVVETGGVPAYTLETDQELSDTDAQDLLNQWVASRTKNLGAPPVLDNNVTLKTHQSMAPRDLALLELTQFTESRIAVLLGVPPYMVALPSSGGESVPYANVQQVFDFHDRAMIKSVATDVMAALSDWALPAGTLAELNRDEYTRPEFAERVAAYVQLVAANIMSVEEVRIAERLSGPAPAVSLTGGMNDPTEEGALL